MTSTFERSRLSAREDAILEAAIEGMTDAQIAQQLEITQSTVNSYWVRIRGKLGQLSRTELVALALKEKARSEMNVVTAQLAELRDQARTHARLSADYENAEVFRAAFDATPEAVMVSCERGIIRYANERLEGLFGYGRGEMVGLPVSVLLPPGMRDGEAERIAAYAKDPKPIRLGISQVIYGQRRNGTRFRIVLLIDARPVSTGLICTTLVRDFAAEIDTRIEHVSSSWG